MTTQLLPTLRLCLSLAAWLLLGGCAYVTVQAPQLSVLRGLFPAAETVDFGSFTWRLRWAGEEQPVIAVSVGDFFLFTHRSGVEVAFDGWQVTQVSGLMGREPVVLNMSAEGSLRIDLGVTVVHQGACEAWERSDQGFTQFCEGLGRNLIILDGAGNITGLSFIIHPAYPALVLER